MDLWAKAENIRSPKKWKRDWKDFYGNYCSEEKREKPSALHGTAAIMWSILILQWQQGIPEISRGNRDATPVVIASTTSPYKFAKSVITAISDRYGDWMIFALCDALSALGGIKLPAAVEEIRTAPVLWYSCGSGGYACNRKKNPPESEAENELNRDILYKFYYSHYKIICWKIHIINFNSNNRKKSWNVQRPLLFWTYIDMKDSNIAVW